MQQQEFLGFNFNTKTMQITVPGKKISKLMLRIKQALKAQPRQHNCRWYASLMGKMTSMIPAIGKALLHIRHMQRDLAMTLSLYSQNWNTQMSLSTESKNELHWWLQWITKKNGHPIRKTTSGIEKTLTIYVDASDLGWGVSSTIQATGAWTTEESTLSINARELTAIYFALKLHAKTFPNLHIKLFTDNITALKYSSKSGGTASKILQDLANIPTTQSDMGAIDDRCVCGQDEHQITNILEHVSGSGSGSHRCLPTNLEEIGNVSIPTVEIHTKGVTNDQIAKNTESGSDHIILANTILVSINTENEVHQPPVDVQDRPVEDGRMVLIRNKRKNVGDLDEDTLEFLTHAQRSSTHKTYNAGWKKWTEWCSTQQNPISPTNLNEEKMWKLKTGTFVERQMERFALTCNFEHPCYSLIFDSGDKRWDKYFTEEELIEIKSYQLKKFPPLPLEMKEYLQTLLKYTSLDLDTLYCKLSTVRLHPVNDSAKEWAQSTILSTIKLFMCNYIPLTDQSESDIIRRIWILLDTVFDHSTIISRSGGKSSSASSDSRNQSRTIASVDPMARKLCGRKIDMIFKSTSAELGCMVCGRSDGVNTTKEMSDSLIKLSKVLKDMFISLCNFTPSLVNDLAIPGVIILNSKFTLVTMDSPCGYVYRLSRVKPIYFPTQPSEIITYLVPILKQVYSIRLLMEQNLTLISAVPVEIDEDISFEVENKVYLPLSFYCTKKNGQKRRKDDMS
ncbi:hypothetical protein G6F33_010833 [Rhizopus arrhizus]|uniref:RNase H type-1 domain-containing protein n=1 Tax=Rhizopus oryzae TaxID=64495 RepID=A0A9P6X2C1_RHIOR|nr:hypothetical protein G6F23_005673 [Rhizopus arrhizus]KAG0758467.1 hypothetical protein G6F24_009776 [Rhizopus arrhizus]KAG0907129.1 hypothetical protein G6F33_010833 [Rhizopus arrhizus]KAG0937440.1 hypothetical protein G6F32_009764 [Rhizopus arrhizus]KAG1289048.1 hypothetical protein G6F66_009488 [Rhizopus arrhizus]